MNELRFCGDSEIVFFGEREDFDFSFRMLGMLARVEGFKEWGGVEKVGIGYGGVIWVDVGR